MRHICVYTSAPFSANSFVFLFQANLERLSLGNFLFGREFPDVLTSFDFPQGSPVYVARFPSVH